jgi:hypothetical protein
MKRNPDGTIRNNNKPAILTVNFMRARWIEAEVLRLRQMGFSFDDIATQVTRIGRGVSQPMVPLPSGVTFPEEFSISRQGCHGAFKRAIAREPEMEAREFRQLDNARTDEIYLNLQPAMRKGHTRSCEVGLKALDHSARVNGYNAPQRHELTGKDGKPLTLVELLEAIGPIDEDDDDKKKQ